MLQVYINVIISAGLMKMMRILIRIVISNLLFRNGMVDFSLSAKYVQTYVFSNFMSLYIFVRLI